jgi:hypothetical protein
MCFAVINYKRDSCLLGNYPNSSGETAEFHVIAQCYHLAYGNTETEILSVSTKNFVLPFAHH